ncbi:TetR/AcrR family transcriptional regulator [Singulisphaera acidiphila]|uniref:Transcriptional regulator n=1 Tax=Singulisphaera acidiphila (strain ATCC BAA-1392 / DSM 18658 / VKM B-2454 / MOB10) TaxID=886293 RepID=L0DQJ5_SINAD|nr:TetR/AcrR family transcriptional regulator [Singulisphaera acidiphila]AGA31213.1 transcriptional regulator [Singulisphaera acidiphila DSM 18658]
MTEQAAETGRRRRGSAATREAILEAATSRFASNGYGGSGVREIAADAGVTAALVNRYFGTKEGLFAEVIERAFDSGDLLGGARADLAARLARRMVFGREDAKDISRTPMLLLLRSATEPRAAELLRANLDRTFMRPLAKILGGPDAEVRAGFVAAQITGFATLDQMIQTEAFTGIDREQLAAFLTVVLDHFIG